MTTRSTSNSSQPIAPIIGVEDIQHLRHRLLNYVLYLGSALGAVLLFLRVPGMLQAKQWIPLIVVAAGYVLILAITFLPERFFNLKLVILLTLTYAGGTFALYQNGLSSDGRLYLLAFVICTNGLTDLAFGLAGTGLAILTLVIISVLASTEIIAFPFVQGQTLPGGLDWTFAIFVFLLISLVATVLLGFLNRIFIRNFESQRSASTETTQLRESLEKSELSQVNRVKKQSSQLDVAGQIAREIAGQSSSSDLLARTADHIRTNFGFYHAGIFMLDNEGEFAVLKAATGDAGREMLAAGHKLRAGEEGIVGTVVKSGEAHIALDVGADAVHFKNPMLPETRSEMAVPLKAGEKTIGALDVQSKEEAAFGDQDVKILQIVADQLAIALEREDLVTRLQQTVNELRTGYQTYMQTAWDSFTKKSGKIRSIEIAGGKEVVNQPSMGEDDGQKVVDRPVVTPLTTSSGEQKTTVMLPIKLRDLNLGSIKVNFDSQMIPANVLEFMQTASDRLALSLENARLLEEIEDRAEQEHLVREISEKVTSSPDISEILKTAAAELGKSLGVTNVKVVLKPEQKEQPTK